MSVKHIVRSSASLLLLVGAHRSGAQSTNPLLPDATVLPSRGIRVRASAAFTRADELLGAGGQRNLASPLALDSLGARELPLLAPAETTIRAASGLANFRITAGRLVAIGNSRVVTAPVILEYGLSRRLTFGVVVPLVETRTTLYAQLNPTLGSANVGPNPAFGGSGVLAQNNELVTSLRSAADTLQARVAACQMTPADPMCGPIAGKTAAVQTLIQNTTAIATALERLYGTSAENPGQAFVPLAKDASQDAINAQIAALQKAYHDFLTKDLVTGSVTGAAGPAANLVLQSLLTNAGRDTVHSVDRSSIGDILVGVTYQLANTFEDTSSTAASARHYRLALNGTFRVGTGQPGSRNRLFDFGTGYGQPGIILGAAGDAQINRRVSATAVVNYTLQLGTIDVARVPNANNEAFPLGAPYPGTYSAGNVLALSVLPRYRLAGNFSVNAQYAMLHTSADRYTLGALTKAEGDSAAEVVTPLPPTAPYGLASSTAHRIGIGFSYSTVAGPDAHPGRIPFEITFNHLETIAGSGGPLAKAFRDELELRVYLPRWPRG